MKKIIIGILAVLGAVFLLALIWPSETPTPVTQSEQVRLTPNVRNVYLKSCVDATEGATGGYDYCECTMRWFENNSPSNAALLKEFADYGSSNGDITARMEKAIDYCIGKFE